LALIPQSTKNTGRIEVFFVFLNQWTAIMGIFYVDCSIENVRKPRRKRLVAAGPIPAA
jgi:hypothetical protein